MERNHFVDFSQYYSYLGCPFKWWEKSVNQMTKAYPKGAQRDDNLAIGSLVHAGLESWYKSGEPSIPSAVVEELGPTPDALALCNSLLQGYVRQYPVERWKLVACEEPVRAPLVAEPVAIDLLAKIDSYFLVEEQMPLNSGVDGYDLSLAAGYWIQEFKTKAQSIDRGKWIKGWVTNMQASFQLLALQYKLRDEALPVQGVLVSVLEKPKAYVPKRKCKSCADTIELSSWMEVPGAAGTYACPLCGNKQALKAYEPKTLAAPSYFRIAVTRSEAELVVAKERIVETALAMQRCREDAGLASRLANTTACNGGFFGPCEFFRNHTYNIHTVGDPDFQRTRDYVGETPLVSIDEIF